MLIFVMITLCFTNVSAIQRTAEATEVAERIIDVFPANEGNDWTNENALTLAAYDLSKAYELRDAFENMASELYAALDNPELFSQISRRAEKVSSMCAGIGGLLDLYDFAKYLHQTFCRW